jgi:hypothetical protein
LGVFDDGSVFFTEGFDTLGLRDGFVTFFWIFLGLTTRLIFVFSAGKDSGFKAGGGLGVLKVTFFRGFSVGFWTICTVTIVLGR